MNFDGLGRTKLTVREAMELARFYANQSWSKYSSSIEAGLQGPEDIAQEVMMKMTREYENKSYAPDWEPGDPYNVVVGRSGDATRTISTEYMLRDGYNPEDPYDPNYYLPHMKTYNYLDKYSGRTTSKKYYIMTAVENYYVDLTRKKSLHKGALDLDAPIGDDSGSRTFGETIPDESDNVTVMQKLRAEDLKNLLTKVISSMPIEPLSPRIKGWSPLTGELDSSGNHVDSHLTARDIGLFILNGYNPSDVTKLYYDTKTKKNISDSTLARYWKDSLEGIRYAILHDEALIKSGYLDSILGR